MLRQRTRWRYKESEANPNGVPHTSYSSNGRALWRARRSLWGEIKRKDEQADREALARIVPDTLLARQLKQYDDGPECELRFAGQWEDEESGLHYNLHRYYDPKAGQYLSSDPIGLNGGLRTHAYVHDPVQWVDPWGLAGCGETSGAAKKLPARITPKSLPAPEEQALLDTLGHIDSGTVPKGVLAKKWGTQFKNFDGDLPGDQGATSPYQEYRVAPPSGTTGAGPNRIVVNGETGEMYYTWTHYGDAGDPAFVQIR